MKDVQSLINKELERAKKLHTEFPSDIVYQSAILAEEAGECVRAALNAIFECGDIEEFYTEATHAAAVAIRILENRKPLDKQP